MKLKKGGAEDLDALGFTARLQGYEVRDCIVVQRPYDERPIFVLILRKSLEGATLTDVFVREGRGVFDIDACRIATASWDQEAMKRVNTPGSGKFKTGTPPIGTFTRVNPGEPHDVTKGRFPSNLILLHSPSCVRGGEENTEQYCEPSCPVYMLDKQSGVLTSGVDCVRRKPALGSYNGGHTGKLAAGAVQITYGDSGGASRYFYQAGTEDELDTYLEALVRGSK